MSKFADRIRRVSRLETLPMGFGAGASRKRTPSMLCLLRLSADKIDAAAEATARGADSVIFDSIDGAKLKEQAQKADSLLLGVWMGAAERDGVAAQREAGADFVVLEPQSASAETLLEEGIGLVLALGQDISDTSLRLLADLPLDALLVPAPVAPLTVARLLEVRRIAVLARTPLLMEVGQGLGASRLQALRDAGVAGVILDGEALDRLPDLRAAIDALPARGRRREERPEAVLPAHGVVAPEEEEEGGEEEVPFP